MIQPLDKQNENMTTAQSSKGLAIEVVEAILAFLATLCVILRVWARRLCKVPLGLDDYLVTFALLVHHACLSSALVGLISGGIGRDIRSVAKENPDTLVILFKVGRHAL